MQKVLGLAGVVAIILASGAVAGPWEDGMVAYNRRDYVPAIKLFRPMAQAGNTKAQNLMGMMYHKGEGVARSSAKAFMWFSLAAKSGDTQAKTQFAASHEGNVVGGNGAGQADHGGLRSIPVSRLRGLITRCVWRTLGLPEQQEFREAKCASGGFFRAPHWR
jgi:hypothetical protein